eukprot:391225_1
MWNSNVSLKYLKSATYVKPLKYFLFEISNVHKSTLLENDGKKYKRPIMTIKMNSHTAVKKIKDLQKYNEQNMITKAFEIYNDLDETQKNEFVINAVLNCCKKMLKK